MIAKLKALFLGVIVIFLVGIGGLVYRNAVEHPNRPIACPLDALLCPDGTAVGRTGLKCEFPACPPPNVSLVDVGIAYAVPEGFISIVPPDDSSIAAYASTGEASTTPGMIIIRQYAINASSTALSVIGATAIGGASGAPVPTTSYSSLSIGGRTYTVVPIERFEGVISTAYYLKYGEKMLRFDAVDRGVMNWSDPSLKSATLPSHKALRTLLTTLQGE